MHSAFSSEVEASPARNIRPENPDHHDRLSSPRRLVRRLVRERGVQHLSRNVPPGGPRVRRSLRARVANYRGATSAPGTTCRRSRTSCQALNLPDVQRHLVATCLRPARKPGTHCHPIADPAASREKQIVYRLPRALLSKILGARQGNPDLPTCSACRSPTLSVVSISDSYRECVLPKNRIALPEVCGFAKLIFC